MKGIIRLLILTLLFAAVGCSSVEPEIIPEYGTDDAVGFSGQEFILSANCETGMNICYVEDTFLSDTLTQRISDIEKEYDFQLKTLYTGSDATSVLAKVASDSCEYDLYYMSGQGDLFSFVGSGVFEDLSLYEDILHFERGNDDKWGSVYVRELGMVDGKQYGLSPYSWPETRTAVTGLFAVNEDLCVQFSKPDPREYVENREWTWSTFETFLEECTFFDSFQRYGAYVSSFRGILSCAFLSNGCEVVYIDKNGTVQTDLKSNKGLRALTWSQSLLANHLHCFYNENPNIALPTATEYTPIANGEVFLQQVSTTNYALYYAYNVESRLGLVPFPVGPEGTWGEWGAYSYGSKLFSIFSTGNDTAGSALILNAFCEPLEGFEDNNALLEYYEKNLFSDTRDAELYLSINNMAKYSCNYYPVGGHTFWNNLGTTAMTPNEYIEGNLDAYMQIVEKHMLPNVRYMQELTEG